MKGSLLDVNVLLALAWPNHQFHGSARRWFATEAQSGWWTCAITELGFVRLSSNPAYSPHAKSPAEAALLFREMTAHPGHRYADSLPALGDDRFAAIAPRLHGHRQVTDAYLLLVAEHHDLQLVTFDRRLAALTSHPGRVARLD